MKDTYAIKVKHLSKEYYLGKKVSYLALRDVLSETIKKPLELLSGKKNEQPKIWAVDDISFKVKKGEVLGLVGRNGAGKTTLLKILSRITTPTQGEAILRGRVASLLEVGTGFNPELTGRENIFLNGSILGMTRKEIKHKFDEIVDFSGVEKFIDTPVKRYSSGMYVRLAFSVAAHLESEIMLIDEVLAVGDVGFQEKCMGKMRDVAGSGRTIIFVSHNMAAVRMLCNKALYIDHGKLIQSGETEKIVGNYLKEFQAIPKTETLKERTDRQGKGEVKLTAVYVRDASGQTTETLYTGEEYTIHYQYECDKRLIGREVDFGSGFINKDKIRLARVSTKETNAKIKLKKTDGEFICQIDRLPLTRGEYTMGAAIYVDEQIQDYLNPILYFKVLGGDFYKKGVQSDNGPVVFDHQWTYKSL